VKEIFDFTTDSIFVDSIRFLAVFLMVFSAVFEVLVLDRTRPSQIPLKTGVFRDFWAYWSCSAHGITSRS
jgi:hypothetical protein